MNRKKTIFISILVIVALCVAAWFYGYYNHKSNDNLPPLKSIVTMDEGDANALLTGYHTEQLMEVWGEPNKATTNELVWQVGDSVLVVSANNKGKVVVCSLNKAEQNAAAPNKCLDEVAGNITFYEEPVKEAQNSGGTVTIRLSRDLNEEQADMLKDILDDVDEWVDDHSVDRLAYYFDGDFELSDREHSYYFTYEYNVIYYDHYYAEISAEDMQYIKDLGAECVELPDIETNSISFNDLAPGTETTFGTKIDVLTDNSELAYTLTYGRASISLEIGLRSEDGTELATEITGGDAKGVISNVPAGTYTVFLRNIEVMSQEVTETPNVTGALHFYIVELPGIERTDEPDEYPDTNIVPGFDLDEPYEPTEYTNYYDIEEQVELCKGTVDEKTKVTIKFQSTEGPSTFAVEVWHRASANDEWTKSESKSALVGDAPAFTVPAASEYIVMVTATAGSKGNVTFFVSCS